MKRIALCFGLMSLNVGTFAEVIPINEIKTDTHIWVDIFDIPYVRAKALQFGVNGNPLNDVGCGPLGFEGFCSDREKISALKKVCYPNFNIASKQFGSLDDYANKDYKILAEIGFDFDKAFNMYDKYLNALIAMQTNSAQIDGISARERHHRLKELQKLNALSDEWRQERLLATDSLNKSIWRLADAYDKIEEGKEKIRSNIERVSDRAASNSGSVATDVGSGLIAGLRDGLKSLEDQRITSHKDDFNTIYSSVQFYSNDGDIKTLSHPLCAMQLYSGISFNIEPGQSVPGCLGIIQNKSALASKWKRLCSSFVHSYSANENVGQWLNSILASGQQASRVHRIVEKSNIGLSSADAALGGIEKLYGSKVASDIGTLVGAKRLDQHSTDRVDYNSERTEFISMLESDRSLTTTEKLRLINQYDRKFGEG